MRHALTRNAARLIPILAFALAIVRVTVAPSAALAHAELAKADPVPGAVLAQSPARVDLWFTERLTVQVSQIQVYDAAEHRVDRGDAQVDQTDARHLSLVLGPLPTGTYTVVWSNVSADDGHPDRGGYAFSVQLPTFGSQMNSALSRPSSASTAIPTPGATALHRSGDPTMADANVVVQSSDRIATAIDLISGWFTFGALVLVEGGACFALLCLLPALRRAGQDGLLLSATLNRRFAVLTMLCATAGGGAALLSLVAKAEIATALPPATLVSIGRLGPMLTSPAGHAWLGREFIFVGLLVVAVVAHRLFEMANVTDWSDKVDQHHADRRQPWHAVVTSLDSTDLTFVLIAELAAAGLLFQAMDSHLAAGMVARHGPLGIVALCCHLLAAGLWVGGLAYGAIFLWPIWRRLTPPVQTAIAGHAVARFSPIALSSVMVITISGTYAAVLLVPAPSDLLTSAYGQALDVKVALLLVLVLFGAANRRTLASIACATHPGGRHTAGLGQRLSRLFPHREAVRQLSATVSTAGTRLIRSIRREFLVAAAALLAAATMLEVGPPNAMPVPQLRPLEAAVAPASIPEAPPPVRPTPSPAASPVPPSYASSAKSGDLTLSLRADPTLAGATSTITVHVASDNGAPTIDAQVKLWLTAQTLDMGTQVLTAKPAAQGMYQVVAPAFAAPGNWQVLLVVRRDNVPEVDQRFIIPVQAPSPNTAAARQATNTPVPNPMREALAR